VDFDKNLSASPSKEDLSTDTIFSQIHPAGQHLELVWTNANIVIEGGRSMDKNSSLHAKYK
jgi:hypothetical protein